MCTVLFSSFFIAITSSTEWKSYANCHLINLAFFLNPRTMELVVCVGVIQGRLCMQENFSIRLKTTKNVARSNPRLHQILYLLCIMDCIQNSVNDYRQILMKIYGWGGHGLRTS